MDDLTPELAHSPAKRNEPETPVIPTRFRKLMKRLMILGIGLLVIAIVIFFMLPVWMSNEQGRNYLLSRFNKRINGKVTVGSWSLSWFSGTDIKNLVLTGADGKVILACPHIKTDLTLWSLLWGNYDLGNTVIDSPQITAARYADGSTDFSRLVPALPAAGPNPLLTLRAYITWNNGVLEFSGPTTSGKALQISNFSGEVPIASNSAPIHLQSKGSAGGAVTLLADLPPSVTWTESPAGLVMSLKLTASGIPTAPVAEWAGLSPRWDDSVGPVITNLSLTTESRDGNTAMMTLSIHGAMGTVDARGIIKGESTGGEQRLILTLAAEKGSPPLTASLRLSEPLVEVMAHINPVLIGMHKADNFITFQSPEMIVDLLHPETVAARVFVTLPSFTLIPSPLMNDILSLSSGTTAGPIAIADTNGINLTIARQRIVPADVVITLPTRQRLTFSGSIGFDDSVDLVLKTSIPSAAGSASVSAVTIPITGKVHSPLMAKP